MILLIQKLYFYQIQQKKRLLKVLWVSLNQFHFLNRHIFNWCKVNRKRHMLCWYSNPYIQTIPIFKCDKWNVVSFIFSGALHSVICESSARCWRMDQNWTWTKNYSSIGAKILVKELGNIKSRHWDLYAKPDTSIGLFKKPQNVVFSIL